jgi:hypothetical protein
MSSLRISSYRSALSVAACAALVVVAGCGSRGKPGDAVLAKVGDKEITASYYEQKLGALGPADLPRDDKGELLDTAELPGKLKFLNTIINKDVMVATAKKAGMDGDPRIETARKTLISYESVGAARERYINKPAAEVSEQDILAYYENFGRIRKCRYLITNLREDALKAREKALTGTTCSASSMTACRSRGCRTTSISRTVVSSPISRTPSSPPRSATSPSPFLRPTVGGS